MNRRFVPREERMLVRPDKPESRRGSLQVPGAQQEKQVTGTIIAIGNSCDGFAIGDRIQWAPYAQTETVQDGETLYILRAESVHGWWVEEE